MTLTFYKMSTSPKRLDKSGYLEQTISKSGVTILDDNDIEDIQFRMKYDSRLWTSNYCYCAQTGRFYFIKDIDMKNGKTIVLHCEVDVLNSFKTPILENDAWISTGDWEADPAELWLYNAYPLQERSQVLSAEFPSGFDPYTEGRTIFFVTA